MKRLPFEKYKAFPYKPFKERTWPDKRLEKAPLWCSVDLRDGNQALVNPMDVATKIKFFKKLCQIGFKEIEIGFPAASETELQFAREIINNNLCPDDVHMQILCQAREELIINSFKAMDGAKNVIFHLYNSTSELQRRVVFKKSKDEIKDIAVNAVRIIKKLSKEYSDMNVVLQYSPESYTGTETDYALEVCEAVMDEWEATPDNKVILNLPATVEMHSANVYADSIEWLSKNLRDRNRAIISIHTHNDRGQGVAASELGLLAGGERVEGTLFGNGERTGNVDLVIMAMNLYSHGIDPKLALADIKPLMEFYEECTDLPIHPRHPYVGKMVYTAFSGSHQDAIKKGLDALEKSDSPYWEAPYLHIDPSDLGFEYEAIIRINSQSGKGGVSYVLESNYGFKLPRKLQIDFSKVVQRFTDKTKREVTNLEIKEMFYDTYVNSDGPLAHGKYKYHSNEENTDIIICESNLLYKGESLTLKDSGNGPINAFVNGIKKHFGVDFQISEYSEHTLGFGSNAKAACYIEITFNLKGSEEAACFGVGLDSNIITASYKAILTALNRTGLID